VKIDHRDWVWNRDEDFIKEFARNLLRGVLLISHLFPLSEVIFEIRETSFGEPRQAKPVG